MHESVSATAGASCTRPWFEWANAMYVVLYEDTFGERYDGEAEVGRLAAIRDREGGGSVDALHYDETLEATVRH